MHVRSLLLFALAPLSGCLFDASLLDQQASDVCSMDAPLVQAGEVVSIDTSAFSSSIGNAACVGNVSGNDAFVRVEMQVGEKWHFHVRNNSAQGVNPAVYVLPASCDARVCRAGDAIDVCGSDRDEHLSFVARTSGTFIVGVDSSEVGGAPMSLEVYRPTCGNLTLEHSEGCDDGTTACDSECRSVLAGGANEVEPNDDFTSANVAPGDGSAVRGTLVDLCDLDMFVVDVAEGESISAIMRDVSGEACAGELAPFTLTLLGDDGVTTLGQVSSSGDDCPNIDGQAFAQGLSAGEYYVRLTTSERDVRFEYQLTLDAQ